MQGIYATIRILVDSEDENALQARTKEVTGWLYTFSKKANEEIRDVRVSSFTQIEFPG